MIAGVKTHDSFASCTMMSSNRGLPDDSITRTDSTAPRRSINRSMTTRSVDAPCRTHDGMFGFGRESTVGILSTSLCWKMREKSAERSRPGLNSV